LWYIVCLNANLSKHTILLWNHETQKRSKNHISQWQNATKYNTYCNCIQITIDTQLIIYNMCNIKTTIKTWSLLIVFDLCVTYSIDCVLNDWFECDMNVCCCCIFELWIEFLFLCIHDSFLDCVCVGICVWKHAMKQIDNQMKHLDLKLIVWNLNPTWNEHVMYFVWMNEYFL